MKLTAKVLIPILAVSLSQIARAIAFNSIASGNWSDPLSWDDGILVPDTYATDSAIINAGNVIDYNDIGGGVGSMTTPAGLVAAGGFAIVGGNSLTIDGGTLKQTALAQEMRIGEGSSGAGIGTLTIQTGGTLNTGASIGLGVGTKISGVQAGNGLLDIKNGSLILGAGASAGGLGIGVQGSNGVMLVGDGVGGAGNAVVDLATNDIQMGVGVQFGAGAAGTGAVTVSSDGAINFLTKNITVGSGGGTGTLTLLAGGTLTGTSGSLIIGDGALSTGTLANAGIIGNVSSTGEVRIGGNGGTGTFTMTAGALNTTGDVNVGTGAGSTGNATHSGGAVTGNNFHVGIGGGTGTYSASTGASLIFRNEMKVGDGAGSVGTFNIAGATAVMDSLATDPFTRVGTGGGTGTVNITGGGTLNTTNTWLGIGDNNGSTGTASVDGAGSTLTTHGLIVGWSGQASGTLNISNNAVVTNTSHEVSIGRDYSGSGNNATGTVNISSGGTLNAGVDLRVGHNTTGIVNINGGNLNTSGGWAIVGDGGTSNGAINMTAGTINSADWMVVGNNTGAQGAMNITGGTLNVNGGGDSGRLITGRLGTAVVNQSGGAVRVGNWFAIGIDPGGNGTYNMSGGTLTVRSNIDVANRGTGTLNITNGNAAGTTITQEGGAVLNAFSVGNDTGGNGTLNIALANATDKIVSRELYAGQGAGTVGLINVTKGTLQTNEWVEIGRNGGTGTVNVSGPNATWARGTLPGGVAKDVQIGYNGGTGNLNVSNGGTVTHNWWFNVARGNGSVGNITVDGAGSTITQTDGQFNVGENGTGTLTITNGGLVTTPNNEFTVARNGGSTGTVNIASGGKLHLGDRAFIGRAGGSTGILNVSGVGSEVTAFNGGGGDFFRVASGGANGTVNVTAGATLATNNGWFTVGENNGSVGNALVSGAGSTLSAHGIIVGWNGSANGTLTIENNAVVTNTQDDHEVSIGRDNANTQGTININSGGILNARRNLRVGNNGIANLNLNGGTLNSSGGWAIVGDGGSSNGFVNMTGASTFNHPNDSLMIGNNPGAHGTWTQAGTSVTNIGGELNIGRNGGIGVVNVNGGVFQTNGWTTMGRDGNNGSGVINVTNGGEYRHQTGNNGDFLLGWTNGSSGAVNVNTGGTVNYSWWTRVAVDGGSTGAITVDGATSNWNNTAGRVFIGESGNGTLNITNGGHFTMTNADWFVAGGNDGANSKGTGIVTISGAGSSLTSNNFLAFGRGRQDASNLATGTLNMTSGSISSTNSWIGFGTDKGTGTANISGTATGTSANETIIGRGVDSIGTFNLSGTAAWTANGEFQVGNSGGNGTVNMSGGTLQANSWFAVGRDGGTGVFNLTGGTVTKGAGQSFDIGVFGGSGFAVGTGTLNQSLAGALINTGSDTNLGRDASGVGTWNMSGGAATLANLFVGNGGSGALNMTGGTITANEVHVAQNGGSSGTANLAGGVITTAFVVAGGGTASLTLSGGTLKAKQDQGDFIRGFSNSGGHSAINLAGSGGTIDTNGFTVTVTAGNILDGTALTKTGNGTLNINATQTYNSLTTSGGVTNVYTALGTGTSSLTANATTNIYVSQTLSSLSIGAGATVTFGDGLPFAPAPSKFGGGSASVVPEPGSIGLLLVGTLGLMARRRRSR